MYCRDVWSTSWLVCSVLKKGFMTDGLLQAKNETWFGQTFEDGGLNVAQKKKGMLETQNPL